MTAANSSTDEDSKELNTAVCVQSAGHTHTHSYKKSLRLSSDQIVRSKFGILLFFFRFLFDKVNEFSWSGYFYVFKRRAWALRMGRTMWCSVSQRSTRAHVAVRAPSTCGTGMTRLSSLTSMAPSLSMLSLSILIHISRGMPSIIVSIFYGQVIW